MEPFYVRKRYSTGAQVKEIQTGGLRLDIPSGSSRRVRLAQVDDYAGLRRKAYPWSPPVDLSLRARAVSADVPGTWGFGFWNAPGKFSLGLGRTDPLPALPQAAWFFYAPRASHLTFRDDLPGRGFLAQTFRSTDQPIRKLLPVLFGLPLFAITPVARRLRTYLSRRVIHESGSAPAGIDVTGEHEYRLVWGRDSVDFRIDGDLVHTTRVSPASPLALVIWIDNQFAAFTPEGRLRYGLHGCPEPQWLEIKAAAINARSLEFASAGYNSEHGS
ncbi:MAG TPA: hypothetical protein VMN57_10270 [Anaerolineales bacterium]|nr:hypothetical protein [Anaerolineales bacterium]